MCRDYRRIRIILSELTTSLNCECDYFSLSKMIIYYITVSWVMAVIYIHVKHGCASGCTAALLLVVCWCPGAVALLPYKAVLCCNRALQLSNESNKGSS